MRPRLQAFRLEFFVSSADQLLVSRCQEDGNTTDSSTISEYSLPTEAEKIGIAHVLPSSMYDTFGKSVILIFGKSQQPIGTITVDYLFIRALKASVPKQTMQVSYCRHWKKRTTLEVGHRGMGSSYTKFSSDRENTVHSLNVAAAKGADYVEFDVQLTKNKIPVIFHDFHIFVSVAKRTPSQANLYQALLAAQQQTRDGSPPEGSLNPIDQHQMAVKDLKLEQLHLLQLSHLKANESPPSVANCDSQYLALTGGPDEHLEHRPFPTLKQALSEVKHEVGFNIEIKYPMLQTDLTWECEHYWERNEYIDLILMDVLNYAGDRRIVFSSFDPDICTLINLKQSKYPVLFLVVGNTTRYIPFLDERSSTSATAVAFVAGNLLLGVNFHSEELLRDKTPVSIANSYGLVTFVWGDDLDSEQNIQYFKNQLGVDGVIYDRMGRLDPSKENVFTFEREKKSVLFKLHSRSPSATSREPKHSFDFSPLQSSISFELSDSSVSSAVSSNFVH